MLTVKRDIEIHRFDHPKHVNATLANEVFLLKLKELSPEELTKLCDDFVSKVFAEAEKPILKYYSAPVVDAKIIIPDGHMSATVRFLNSEIRAGIKAEEIIKRYSDKKMLPIIPENTLKLLLQTLTTSFDQAKNKE